MIFDENVAEMARADRSNALLIAAINELSRPYELDELTRVMREFLPARTSKRFGESRRIGSHAVGLA